MLLASIIGLGTLLSIFIAIIAVFGLLILFVVVLVMLYRRTRGQQPSQVVTLPGLHTPVDLGIFTGLFNALSVRPFDQQRVLKEFSTLTFRAGEAGGIEALLEQFVYRQIEAKLATPGKRTLVLSGLARVLGVSERALLDLAEGKTAAPAAVATGEGGPSKSVVASSSVIPIAAPLLAMAVLLFAAGDGLAVEPLRSPQRFYPAEVEPVVDPPTFRTAALPTGTLGGPQRGEQLIAPQGVAWQGTTYYPVASRGWLPWRWFRARCR